MTRHNVTITTGSDQNEHRVEIDGRDIAPGLRSVNVEFGPGGRRPKIVMELSASMIDVIDLASPDAEVMLSLPDGAREALIAFGWTPPGSPRPGVARFGGWEFETHTRPEPSDDARYEDAEVPTGQVTFRCDCGHRIHDRNNVVLGKARTHLAEEHPTWDQIPEEVEAGSPPPASIKIENYTAGSPEDTAASLQFGLGRHQTNCRGC